MISLKFQGNSLLKFLTIGLVSFLIIETLFSLGWRLKHDAALLQYVAFQILEFDKLPYRDIFDINLPGTHLFHIVWIRLFGLSDPGFRVLDIIWTGSILFLVYSLVRQAGMLAAWIAVSCIGLIYMSYSPTNALQREWIMLLPTLIAVKLSTLEHKRSEIPRLLAAGFLTGYICLVKPQGIVFLPFLYYWYRKQGERTNPKARGLKFIGFVSAGMLLPFVMAYFYLNHYGLLPYLGKIVFGYYPLHAELSGGHMIVTGFERWRMLIDDSLKLGGNTIWLAAAFLGSVLYFKNKHKQQEQELVRLMIYLCVVFAIYPALSGQFWHYHWMPFVVFAIIVTSLTLFSDGGEVSKFSTWAAPLILITCLAFGAKLPVAGDFVYQVLGKGARPPNNGRADEIAEYLQNNLKDGDTVQPLDWTGGGVQACLISRANLATEFVCDAQFYHHLDSPVIQELRNRFMTEMMYQQPDYIIEITGDDKPWVSGPGTTRIPHKLYESYVDNNYELAQSGDGYRILKSLIPED